MIHAYNEKYLYLARKQLASMFDYAVNGVGVKLESFYITFLISDISKKIQRGDSSTIAGKSGVELAMELLNTNAEFEMDVNARTPEYWLGYYLSFYQWYTGYTFEEIEDVIPINQMVKMYRKYHEMDVMHFVDDLNELMIKNRITNLKKKRLDLEYSQSKLAKESNIPLRTIQQYEQRQKNINNAKASTLLSLAKALHCDIEDLLEKIDS